MLITLSGQALSPVSSWNWLCDTSVAGDITSVECGWIALTCSFTSAHLCIILECPLNFFPPGNGSKAIYHVLSLTMYGCAQLAYHYLELMTSYSSVQCIQTVNMSKKLYSFLMPYAHRKEWKETYVHFWEGAKKRIAPRRLSPQMLWWVMLLSIIGFFRNKLKKSLILA